MTLLRTAVIAGAIFASTPLIAIAQEGMPPRVVGSVQVDAVTQAPVRVLQSVTLDATPADVFDFVSDASNWTSLVSIVESVKIPDRGRAGSNRTFTLTSGGEISERIVAYDEPGRDGVATFAYAIAPDNPFGIEGHLAVVHLTPADGGGTALHYHQFLNHPNLEAVLPVVAGGTDEIVGNILAEFGGQLRGTTSIGTKIEIKQQRVVEASASRAWTVLGDQWDDVAAWSSMITHSESRGWDPSSADGAIRSCEVPGTPGFRETMIAYDEDEMTLAYKVLAGMPPFATNTTNTWNIEPLGDDRVVITSVIAIDTANGTPPPAISMVAGQFTQVIDMTFDELAYFIEHDRKHPRALAAADRP